MNLKLRRAKRQVIHVSPEPGPVSHPVDGALLSCEDASDLLQLLLVPLQITDALSLKQVELLLPVLIHGDVFAHVGVEAEIGVGREEGVEHGVNLWRGRGEVTVRPHKHKHDISHMVQTKITNTQLKS